MKENRKKRAHILAGTEINPSSLSRFFKGKASFSARHMQQIVKLTGGAVGFADLIREADRRKRARAAAAVETVAVSP